MKLGYIPSPPHRVATAPTHRFGATYPPPKVIDRSKIDYLPELYDNDHYSDCTAVGYVNGARAVAALNGYKLSVDPGSALAFYAACVGWPANLAETNGAVVLDVLERQQSTSVPIGPQNLVARFVTVDPDSRASLASCINRLGFGYWGVQLRDRDMQTFGTGTAWDVLDGRDDGPAIGGHLLLAWDYTGLGDDATVRLGTWGEWQPATWTWVGKRLLESYGLVWRQLARADGFYNGVDAGGLITEL